MAHRHGRRPSQRAPVRTETRQESDLQLRQPHRPVRYGGQAEGAKRHRRRGAEADNRLPAGAAAQTQGGDGGVAQEEFQSELMIFRRLVRARLSN